MSEEEAIFQLPEEWCGGWVKEDGIGPLQSSSKCAPLQGMIFTV
jgi:hypothetical protein